MSYVLEIKNINKTMKNKKIIDNLSFFIEKGEIFGFVGPNGSGKTTTIKMITGLLSIDDGEIWIQGENIHKDFEGAMRKVGAIVENPELYKHLTGMQNLWQYARMYEDNIDEKRIKEIVDVVKMNNLIHKKVKEYSLGMRQRLGLAQALLHKPDLLILDEPTNGLDPAGIKDLRIIMQTLSRENGLSVLVSSHLLNEMELLCDRFGVIDKGHIIDFINQRMLDKNDTEKLDRYIIELDDTEIAMKAINDYKASIEAEEKTASMKAKIKDGRIHLVVTREQIALINEALVRSGIKVYGIVLSHTSLEDEFLQITNNSDGQLR